MKFIAFWEFCPEEIDKVIEKNRQVVAEREKHPDKYPTVIFGPFGMGENKGFTCIETEEQEKLSLWQLAYWPHMMIKFVPIYESTKIIEQWQRMKK